MGEETKSVHEHIDQPIQNEEITPQIDWHEKYLYLAAEIDNIKKRYQKTGRIFYGH